MFYPVLHHFYGAITKNAAVPNNATSIFREEIAPYLLMPRRRRSYVPAVAQASSVDAYLKLAGGFAADRARTSPFEILRKKITTRESRFIIEKNILSNEQK